MIPTEASEARPSARSPVPAIPACSSWLAKSISRDGGRLTLQYRWFVEEIAIVKTRVENRLAQIRKSRGVGPSALARRVNVSRQTIYAIEGGTYVPNTEVALNLARELEVTVEELFSLSSGPQNPPESL